MGRAAILTFIVGVLVGFMAGGFTPRRELSALRKKHAELEDRMAAMDAPDFLGDLLPRLGAPPPASGRRSVNQRAPTTAEPQADDAPEVTADVSKPSDAKRERMLAGLSELEMMESAQRTRAAASRQTLIEQAALSPEQALRFDGSLNEIQEKLLRLSGRVFEQLSRSGDPDPTEALALGHEVSGYLLQGQQALDGLLAENGTPPSEVDEKARQIWNHIRIDGLSEHVRAAAMQQKASGQPTAGMPAEE